MKDWKFHEVLLGILVIFYFVVCGIGIYQWNKNKHSYKSMCHCHCVEVVKCQEK